MTLNLVTLADTSYAARVLSMVSSLDSHGTSYHLWILCLDDQIAEIMNNFHPENITLLRKNDWEDEQLLAIKSQRSRQEYCWTLTPHSLSTVFSKFPQVELLFYVDSDIFFFKDPAPVYNQFAQSSQQIFTTLHAFSPRLDHLQEFGLFNVQLVGFKRVEGSAALGEWKRQCTEWCFARHENGKFGDQKYLDAWPAKYGDALSIGRPASDFQGPWNVERFSPTIPTTYHFSSLEILSRKYVRLAHPGYPLPPSSIKSIYVPYLRTLGLWTKRIRRFLPPGQLASDRQRVRMIRRVRNLARGHGFREFVPGEKNVYVMPRSQRLKLHPFGKSPGNR